MSQNDIDPYCTNLMPKCGANASKLLALAGVEPELARMVRELAKQPFVEQPCQGDITVQVDRDGLMTLKSENNNVCFYRKSWEDLFDLADT
jgi:hypothetical protein